MVTGMKQLAADFIGHRHMLTAFIEGLVRDPASAEDIFQEVWVRLAAASEKGTPIEDVAKWSRGVAKNLILHYWREQRGAKELQDSRLVEMADLAFGEQGAAEEVWALKRQTLIQCLEGLPEHAQDLLRMKYEEALSIAKIGRRLKRSVNGVMVSLSRLRQALAHCVEVKLGSMGSGR